MALLDAVKMETRKGSIWWDSHHPCAKARPQCQSLPALGAHPKTHLSSSTQGRVSELCRAWLPECRLAVGRKNNSEYAKKLDSSPLTKPARRKSPIQAETGSVQMFGRLLAAAGDLHGCGLRSTFSFTGLPQSCCKNLL